LASGHCFWADGLPARCRDLTRRSLNRTTRTHCLPVWPQSLCSAEPGPLFFWQVGSTWCHVSRASDHLENQREHLVKMTRFWAPTTAEFPKHCACYTSSQKLRSTVAPTSAAAACLTLAMDRKRIHTTCAALLLFPSPGGCMSRLSSPTQQPLATVSSQSQSTRHRHGASI